MADLVAIAYDDIDQARKSSARSSRREAPPCFCSCARQPATRSYRRSRSNGGQLIQSSLSDDQETTLQEALDRGGAA
jgi:uncharacterized membrane protein